MIADYREIPALMRSQREEGKKDRYIELTNALLEAAEKLASDDEKREYVSIADQTLDQMDFQIYELYRSIQDKRDEVAKQLEASQPQDAPQIPESLRAAREQAAAQIKVLKKGGRFAVLQLPDEGKYRAKESYELFVDGCAWGSSDTVVTSLYDLTPDTKVCVEAVAAGKYAKCEFVTDHEYVTINVKDIGAKGDGKQDDTTFIQTAIMICPKDGRVLIPAGDYLIRSIFIKDDINIELSEGARLIARTDREAFSRIPGRIVTTDEKGEYLPGTWEGNPLPMFAGILTGYNAKNVNIYGRGILDGGASRENWWKDPKVLNIAYRPRLFFIHGCKNVTLQGLTLKNSPSWTIHPFFSDDLGFYNVTIDNPCDSPNTDGLDPESCNNVEIAGVKFSLGDDCIAVKAGKVYMGKTYKTPSKNLHIHHCLMEDGHGAVTLGSEMAGGIIDMTVEDCEFSHTDRGLRIKTRRGRGKDAILDGITFRRIDMDNVMTPFTANAFYFCDPDGKTEYVQSREVMPVDDRTPDLRKFTFEDINAKECHVAAFWFDGLPEKKIEEIVLKNIKVTYSPNPTEGQPIMSSGVDKYTRRGFYARNVKKLTIENVSVEGQEGEKTILEGIDELSGQVD